MLPLESKMDKHTQEHKYLFEPLVLSKPYMMAQSHVRLFAHVLRKVGRPIFIVSIAFQ